MTTSGPHWAGRIRGCQSWPMNRRLHLFLTWVLALLVLAYIIGSAVRDHEAGSSSTRSLDGIAPPTPTADLVLGPDTDRKPEETSPFLLVQDSRSLVPLAGAGAIYFHEDGGLTGWAGPGDSIPGGSDDLAWIIVGASGYAPVAIRGPVQKSQVVPLEAHSSLVIELKDHQDHPVPGVRIHLQFEPGKSKEFKLVGQVHSLLDGIDELFSRCDDPEAFRSAIATAAGSWETAGVPDVVVPALDRIQSLLGASGSITGIALFPVPGPVMTDEGGIAEWGRAPCEVDLYWRHDSVLPIDCLPPFVPEELFVRPDGSFRPSFESFLNRRSGLFQLEPGRRTTFSVRAGTVQRVWGRLGPEFDPRAAIRIALVSASNVESSQGAVLRNFDTEGLVLPSEDGGFVFEGVSPGSKQVTVLQQQDGLRWVFAAADFRMPEGEDYFLGTLSPVPGRMELTVGFAFSDGRAIPVSTLMQDLGWDSEPRCDVVVKQKAEGLAFPFWETVRGVPVGEQLAFEGFPEGKWSLQALPGRWFSNLGSYRLVRMEAYAEFFSMEKGRVDFLLERD